MDAQQERVEVEAPIGSGDDDLAVDDEPRRRVADRAQRRLELREVSVQGLEVTRLDVELLPVAEGDGSEAIPFRLVAPAIAIWNLRGRLGEHRLDGRLDGERHGPMIRPGTCAYSRLCRSRSASWVPLAASPAPSSSCVSASATCSSTAGCSRALPRRSRAIASPSPS